MRGVRGPLLGPAPPPGSLRDHRHRAGRERRAGGPVQRRDLPIEEELPRKPIPFGPVHIRLAQPSDLPAIVAVYNQAVRAGFQTGDLAPVTVPSRLLWFEAHSPDRYPILVAERSDLKRSPEGAEGGGEIAGWCSLSPYRPGRAALAHTAEISYYVGERHRRQGVATALLRHAAASCDRLGIRMLVALVLDVNEPSRRLLEREGYERWGHLPGVARFGGVECGHVIYGLRLAEVRLAEA